MRTNGLPKVPEKVEQQHGVDLLRSIGAKVYVIGHPSPSDGRRFRGTGQTPGLPDVFAFLAPRRLTYEHRFDGAVDVPGKPIALWWEVKAVDGRLRSEQAEFQALCRDAQLQHVVGPLDALIRFLVAFHYLKADGVPHYRQAKGA